MSSDACSRPEAGAPIQGIPKSNMSRHLHLNAAIAVASAIRNPWVTDALTGDPISDAAEEFTVDMPFGQTRVFRTEALK